MRSFLAGLLSGRVTLFLGLWQLLRSFLAGLLSGRVTLFLGLWQLLRSFLAGLLSGRVTLFLGLWQLLRSFLRQSYSISGPLAVIEVFFGRVTLFLGFGQLLRSFLAGLLYFWASGSSAVILFILQGTICAIGSAYSCSLDVAGLSLL